MSKSKDFIEIFDQLKGIVGSGNYIEDVFKMNSYLSDAEPI